MNLSTEIPRNSYRKPNVCIGFSLLIACFVKNHSVGGIKAQNFQTHRQKGNLGAEEIFQINSDMADFGPVQKANDYIKDITEKVRKELEERQHEKFPVFEVLSYRTHDDHHTKHLIKAHVGGNKCIHFIICNCNPPTPELKEIKDGWPTKEEALEPF